MKKLFSLFSIITLSFISISSIATNSTEEKKIYYSDDDIVISYYYLNCEYIEQINKEYVILSLQNISNKDITLNWEELIWYDDNCINCEHEGNEFRKEIIVKANTTMEGDCETNNSLRIFSKFTQEMNNTPGINKIPSLTKFELKNISKK